MTRLKICIHPLYFCLLLYYVVIGKFWLFMSNLLAVLLHECAHAFVAKYYGYEMSKIVLMPYGAMVYGEERFYGKVSVKIAIAGPISSFIYALLVMAIWWIFPASYEYLFDFCMANITLGLFNLLPCFPLDGARVVLGLVKDNLKALKVLKVLGCVVGLGLISLGIASFWYQPNITLVNVGAFLIIGTFTASKKEEYYFIASRTNYSKEYKRGVTKREVYVSQELHPYNLVKYIHPRYDTIFNVVDSGGAVKAVLTEKELESIVKSYDIKEKLVDII